MDIDINELQEKYKDDIDLQIVLERYKVITESPIGSSIDLFLGLHEKISQSFSTIGVIDLESESKDVERIKHLMELHFNLSMKIHDGLSSGKFTITDGQKEKLKVSDRDRIFTKSKTVNSALNGTMEKDMGE